MVYRPRHTASRARGRAQDRQGPLDPLAREHSPRDPSPHAHPPPRRRAHRRPRRPRGPPLVRDGPARGREPGPFRRARLEPLPPAVDAAAPADRLDQQRDLRKTPEPGRCGGHDGARRARVGPSSAHGNGPPGGRGRAADGPTDHAAHLRQPRVPSRRRLRRLRPQARERSLGRRAARDHRLRADRAAPGGLGARGARHAARDVRDAAVYVAGTNPGELLDARSDLYAVGCMLYELVVGHVPFAGAPFSIKNGHLSAPPVAPSELVADVPPELERVILKLLEKDLRQALRLRRRGGGAPGRYRRRRAAPAGLPAVAIVPVSPALRGPGRHRRAAVRASRIARLTAPARSCSSRGAAASARHAWRWSSRA